MLMGVGLSNVAHFKTWYKKDFWGIADFSFLQGFTAWNLAVNIPERPIQGGQKKNQRAEKWEFYSISSEEMMTYVDNEEIQHF